MARIKVWPGISSAMSEDLQGGGGLGSVQNITYDKMYIENVDWAIEVTQCYGQKNQTLCNENPVWFYFSIQLFIGEMLFGIVYGIYGLADLVWNRATLRLAMSTSMISPVSHLERMIRMWERLFVRVLM